MKNKDSILIVVTVVLVIAFIGMLFFDSNSAVLKRTLNYDISGELKLVTMDKHGSMFSRNAYEAKVSIPFDGSYELVDMLSATYGDAEGEFLSYEEYQEFSRKVFTGYALTPIVAPNSTVWIQGVKTSEGHEIFHVVCAEDTNHAFLYIYYTR